MQTHILIINHQLAFAVSIKQALERTGNFEVHPFTSIDPALDYLRGHMQDVALVDFTLPGISGEDAVARLRQLQPTLAIIATPRQSTDILQALQLQGTVNTPISAREIIPVVNKAIEGRRTGRLASVSLDAPTEVIPTQPPPSAPQQQESHEPRPGLLGKFDEGDLLRRMATRPSKSKPPTDLPEYTSLDNVLSTVAGTRGLNPPPAAPTDDDLFGDFDLPIQSSQTPALEDEAFNALLEELDSGQDVRPGSTEFDALVKSMRTGEPHQPLPTRHQQFVEFIMTGGMDPLLEEIERKKTDELPQVETVLEPIPVEAVEEPVLSPLPELGEEQDEGTVGDLFSEVSDTSFRNVLSILRGEEESPEPTSAQISAEDMRDAFPQFFATQPMDIDEILNEIEASAQRENIQTRSSDFNFDDEPGGNTARIILATALDESTPVDSFSISALISNIENQLPAHRPKVQPLPSWLTEGRQRKDDRDRFIREPDFLPEVLPEVPAAIQPPVEPLPDFDFGEDWYDQTTRLSSAQQLEAQPEAMETEWLPAERMPEIEELPSEAALEFDFDESQATNEVWEETESYTKPYAIGETQAALAADMPVEAEVAEAPAEFEPEAESLDEAQDENAITDPYIAQLALSLTEVSLELTAEATLLTRDGEFVAFAGRMAREELDELRQAINGDWNANADEARIRFINLEGSGKDYMLFTRRTVDDLTLSLVFSGTTPLRDIRRQGKRLIEALQSVPEVVEIPELTADPEAVYDFAEESAMIEPVEDGIARTPYAYVWMMRDPGNQLSNSVAQALIRGMNSQLRERSWRLQDIQAKEEYVYLLAEVPGETPPYDVIRDLKRRAAQIVYSQNPTLDPDTLWADSYLVVTPGRKLENDEIQQFIQFERML